MLMSMFLCVVNRHEQNWERGSESSMGSMGSALNEMKNAAWSGIKTMMNSGRPIKLPNDLTVIHRLMTMHI